MRAAAPPSPWPLLALCAVAVALRWAFALEAESSPFAASRYLPIDARDYHEWAQAWLAGGWPDPEAFFRPPLYVVLLGAVYAVTGPAPLAVQLLQGLLGGIACALVHGIAREVQPDPRVAWGAAALTALCGTLVYFDGQLLTGSLDVFLQLLTLRLALAAGHRGSVALWAATGLALGAAAINRGTIALWVPFLLVWLLGWPRRGPRPALPASLARAAALALPAALVWLPVAVHNARYDAGEPPASASETLARLVGGRFVTLAGNSGLNLYLGNHPELREVNQLAHPDHFETYDRIRAEPERRGIASYAEANAWFNAETLRVVRASPGPWLRLEAEKLRELVRGEEIPRNTPLYAERDHSHALGLLLWRRGIAYPSGLLIPLGLVGIALSRRQWRDHFPVWTLLFTQAAFLLAFFVTARYRLPMLPLLAIYAAVAAIALFDRLRERRALAALRVAGPLVLLLALSNAGLSDAGARYGAVDHYNLGVALYERGELGPAEEAFRASIGEDPEHGAALANLCKLLVEDRRDAAALDPCRRAAAIDPSRAGTFFFLGTALERTGRREEGAAAYEQAYRLAPSHERIRRAWQRTRSTRRR